MLKEDHHVVSSAANKGNPSDKALSALVKFVAYVHVKA